MTKLSNVKVSTKFVFRDEPGVWKKTAKDKAKCIFGARDRVGIVAGIDPDAEVFVIESGNFRNETVPGNECIKVVFIEDDDKVVCERIVPIGQATVLSTCHGVEVNTGKRKEGLMIGDAILDMEKRELQVEVMTRIDISNEKRTE